MQAAIRACTLGIIGFYLQPIFCVRCGVIELFYSTRYGRGRRCEGPFGRHIGLYAEHLAKQGYKQSTATTHFQILRRFGKWMRNRRWGVRQYGEEAIDRFLRPLSRTQRASQGAPLRTFLQALRSKQIVRTRDRACRLNARERLIREYQEYLSEMRGFSRETIIYYIARARLLLRQGCGHGVRPRIRMLTPKDVLEFVQCHAGDYANRFGNFRSPLRCFLHFLFARGKTDVDLSSYVPRGIERRRLAGLPPTLTLYDVNRVLRSCDQRSAKGRRDFAALLLLADLGLRSGEVTRLTLDDLHWAEGEVTVRGKGRQLVSLPLPRRVGRAIADYLRRDRPKCASRRVFIRMRAPYTGWTDASAVNRLVKRAFQRAGLKLAKMGPHVLRHTLATRLMRRGRRSLSQIAQILRHRDPDSTAIYAKVDIEQLRIAAAPWPKGVR